MAEMAYSGFAVQTYDSGEYRADVVREALSTGAKGYLPKVEAGIELWAAIETVLDNKQYLSPFLRGRHSATIN